MDKNSSSKIHSLPIFALLLPVLLLVLVSCSGAASNGGNTADNAQRTLRIITSTPQDTPTPTVTPTPIVPVLTEDALAGTNLDFWYVWTPAVPDPVAELVKWFNAENAYGIKVTTQTFSLPSEFEAAMDEAAATGILPDLVLAHPYQYQPWVAEDAVVDLTPYLESSTYGMGDSTLADFYPVFLERDVYGGARWGFPGLFTAEVMLYNQTWGKDLGFNNPPSTAEQFQQQACAAAEESGGLEGGYMAVSAPGSAAAWLLSFAGHLVEDGRYLFDWEPVQQAFTFLADLREAGCAWSPDVRYPDAEFFDRQGLFYSVSTVELPYIQANYEASGSSDEWVAIGYPNDSEDPAVSVSGRSYVVMQSTTEQQIAAWLLVCELSGERSQAHMAQTRAYLPLDENAAIRIEGEGSLPDQWYQAAALLENAAAEPRLASWSVIRSVTQDAVSEVLSERFEPGQISLFFNNLIEMVDDLAPAGE